MPLHASKIDLLSRTTRFSSSSPPSITSLLIEPSSHSIAVSLSDSSHLLFPSFSPSSPSQSPTAVSPASAASFLRLLPINRVLFIAAVPLDAGASLAIRAWILQSASLRFAPVRLTYKKIAPATIPLVHGFGVRLIGTVNYFVVHAPAAGQIWVMAIRVVKEEGKESVSMNLEKCTVVECDLPIYSIGMSMEVIVLGEIGGVRVFPLRVLVKGNVMKGKRKGPLAAGKSGDRLLELEKGLVPNGMVVPISYPSGGAIEKVGEAKTSGKATASKISSDSSRLPNRAHMYYLDVKMKVQVLSVPPDIFAKTDFFWISDGAYSVYMMSMDINECTEKDCEEVERKKKSTLLSAAEVIFTSEKVQHITALSAKAILVLGQGNLFAYSIC